MSTLNVITPLIVIIMTIWVDVSADSIEMKLHLCRLVRGNTVQRAVTLAVELLELSPFSTVSLLGI